MPRLPRLTGRRLIKALQKLGFEEIRARGSHHYFAHPDGRRTVVPVHAGETIGPGLLNKILSEADLSVETLQDALK